MRWVGVRVGVGVWGWVLVWVWVWIWVWARSLGSVWWRGWWGRPDRSWGWPAQQETGHRRGPKPGDVPFGSGVWRTSPKEADPTQRGWVYNPPNTCAMRIFATIATG